VISVEEFSFSDEDLDHFIHRRTAPAGRRGARSPTRNLMKKRISDEELGFFVSRFV
jgi:hypothetical protein